MIEEFSDNCYIDYSDEYNSSTRTFISGKWNPKLDQLIAKNLVSEIYLNQWSETDLSCLNKFSEKVRVLKLEGFKGTDITEINKLLNLEDLILKYYPRELNEQLDFRKLQKLRYVSLSHKKKASNVFQCNNLRELSLFDDSRLGDCSSFENMAKLESLHIEGCKLYSFKGIGPLSKLKCLTVANVTIKTLEGLGALNNLEWLTLYQVRGIPTLEPISGLSKLKTLLLGGFKNIDSISYLRGLKNLESIELESMGDVESVGPICNMKKLEKISFMGKTNIIDGKIRCLLDLPELGCIFFDNRRHYDIKWEECKAILEEQGRWKEDL